MNWYIKAFKQYADFKTRASRKEYWMFMLFNCLIAVVVTVFDHLFGTTLIKTSPYGLFYLLYSLFVFVPSIALSVRRMHDIGKSGKMLLFSFVPLIGGIWVLINLIQKGNPDTTNTVLSRKRNQSHSSSCRWERAEPGFLFFEKSPGSANSVGLE